MVEPVYGTVVQEARVVPVVAAVIPEAVDVVEQETHLQ